VNVLGLRIVNFWNLLPEDLVMASFIYLIESSKGPMTGL